MLTALVGWRQLWIALARARRDCLFEWNDWTAVGGSWPLYVPRFGKAHRATTVWADVVDALVLERLTFRNNGAAQSVNAVRAPRHVPCVVRNRPPCTITLGRSA